jgi:hypothetical protein
MKKNCVFAAITLVSLAFGTARADLLDDFKTAYPRYEWNSSRTLSLDFDRDGKPDFAAFGLGKRQAALAIRFGSGKSELVSFPISSEKQFAICGTQEASISSEKQSAGYFEESGEVPDGYQVCEKCYQIVVSGGMCDPLHFYWNKKSGAINWWRE